MANRARSFLLLNSESRSELAKSTTSFDDDVQNMEFEPFVKISCKLFECPISVNVAKILIKTPAKGAKLRQESKYKRRLSIQPPADLPSPESSLEFQGRPKQQKLLVTAVYDGSYELVEILMSKYPHAPIPRVLMQVIALTVKVIRSLTKFTIRQCCIDMYTIYELNKILTISNITDVCLDYSPLKEANYDILLSDPTCLRNLSLSRCNINDIVCERIASRLHHLDPAEKTLLILNLSSNHITDVGLKNFGEALRSNRHLRYLNISDNHIGDAGAKYIFEVLAEFPLKIDEIRDKNSCYMHYLKDKEGLYREYMLNMVNARKSVKKSKLGKGKPTTKRHKHTHTTHNEAHKEAHNEAHKEAHNEAHKEAHNEAHKEAHKEAHHEAHKEAHHEAHKEAHHEAHKEAHNEAHKEAHHEAHNKAHNEAHNDSDEYLRMKARSMALEAVGPFEHPFTPSMVTVKQGRCYCIGNLTLCYLNLRYNNLTYESVQRLAAVVRHQKMYRNEKLCGLLNVLLEGNYVPEKADEYIMINKDVNGTASKLSIKKIK